MMSLELGEILMDLDTGNPNSPLPARESQQLPGKRDEPPPFLGTWSRVYVAVVIYTCVLILALYLMTVALRP